VSARGLRLEEHEPARPAAVAIGPAIAARRDTRLMERIESGDVSAFEELYERFYLRARGVAWSVCRDDGRAEEAVQESFTSIWRRGSTYQAARGTLGGWLLTLVRNCAIDVARKNGRHERGRAREEPIALHSVPGTLADDVVNREQAAKLNGLLRRLPDVQQEVIALAFYGQLTHAEIAAHLGLPQGTVKGRMRLGLQKLRVELDQAGTAERWHLALTGAFLGGELAQARRVITDAGTEMPVVSMLDDVLAPAMHNIGALWRDEEIMVADEHLASTICHRLLAEISPALQVEPAGTRETVLLITPSSEQHTFGLSMAQNVLYGAGYKTVLVGGEAPGRALNAALLRHRPAIVALSSTMGRPDQLAAQASAIRDTLPSAKLITGGSAAQRLPREFGAQYIGRLDGLLARVDAILSPGRGRPLPS
jgi:RNA polymerase sigma-70 factor (ECF subfamily)